MSKKSKVIFVGRNELVDIYQFMSMCGLECEYKSNVKVSHKIMEKKLLKRFEVFPEKIILPERVDNSLVSEEDLLNGYYVAVRDDNKKIVIYKNPRRKSLNDLLFELEKINDRKKLERIRGVLLEELGYIQSVSGEISKKDIIEEEPVVTEKINRQLNVVETGNGRVKTRRKY